MIATYTIIYQCSYMIFQSFAVLLCSVIFVPKKTGRSSRWPTFVLESCFLQSHHCGLTGKPCCAQHDWPRKFLASFGFIHDSYLKLKVSKYWLKKKTSSDYWILLIRIFLRCASLLILLTLLNPNPIHLPLGGGVSDLLLEYVSGLA